MVDVLDQLSIALHAACSCDEHLSPLDGKGAASEQGQASLPLLLPADWVGARLRALMAALPATHWCLLLAIIFWPLFPAARKLKIYQGKLRTERPGQKIGTAMGLFI
jgi:hypothetical protein